MDAPLPFSGAGLLPAGGRAWLARASPLLAAEADPLKPPAIQTQEVPAIPPEFAARLAQYQNTRAAGFAGWSPDGKGMLDPHAVRQLGAAPPRL